MNKYKILVVEDDPALLHSMRIRLGAEGYEVLSAQDAYQAVSSAAKHRPDLLILDIHIPAGDGFSIQERVRKMPGMELTPIIFVTGDASQTLGDKTHEVGARWLLRKPFNSRDLIQIVRQTAAEWEAQRPALTAVPLV
ncbi:MAG TPA: response regulator [Planctomycetota bacterium]|nr:response regulator [Planctomycetota bacterium]